MIAKRLFDLCLAVAGLVLLAPLLVVVAALVKFDTPGPILFRQKRVGFRGTEFWIVKFRTMGVDQPDAEPQFLAARDAHITGFGHFLRARKIDELPQLFNVLAGQMSFVGPRPEIAALLDRYPACDRAIVLSLKPGITDLASIRFRDEGTRLAGERDPEQAYLVKILPRKLRMIRYYARSRSMRLDLAIITKTVTVLVHDGIDGVKGRLRRSPRFQRRLHHQP